MKALTLAALLLGTAGHAATINQTPLAGDPYALDAGQFTTLSTSFSVGSSVTTSCGVPATGQVAILKCPTDPLPDGRYTESGTPWIDSADVGKLRWDVAFNTLTSAFGFGVTDANDQKGSWWHFTVDGVTASIAAYANDSGGPVRWFTVLFDKPVTEARLTFDTMPQDGYGIVSATVAPVPLPAAGLLLLAALGGLGLVRRARG